MGDARVAWLRETVTSGLSVSHDLFDGMLIADEGQAEKDILSFLDAERPDPALVIYTISEAELLKADKAAASEVNQKSAEDPVRRQPWTVRF